jgi:hypothetical protein
MSEPTAAQAARTASDCAERAADEVAEVVNKFEILKDGLHTEDPIPSYYEWIDEEALAKQNADAKAAAFEATAAAEEAEAAEKAGKSVEAAAAAAKAEQAQAKAERALDDTDELVAKAETDEDNLGGPPDDELSDPENVYGDFDD